MTSFSLMLQGCCAEESRTCEAAAPDRARSNEGLHAALSLSLPEAFPRAAEFFLFFFEIFICFTTIKFFVRKKL